MAVDVISVAAATAVVGYNLMTNSPDVQSSGQDRTLDAIALTGSAAAGDTQVEIRIQNIRVASVYNTATGFPTQDASKIVLPGLFIPAGAPLSAIVLDAPATNPLNLQIETSP